MVLGSSTKVVGRYTLTRRHRVVGSLATAAMGGALVAMFVV